MTSLYKNVVLYLLSFALYGYLIFKQRSLYDAVFFDLLCVTLTIMSIVYAIPEIYGYEDCYCYMDKL